MRKILKRIGKYILLLTGGFILLILIGFGFLYLISPGKAEPIVCENGIPIKRSISVIEKVDIGGVDQYLIIRGVDSIKPVLLFLHGGPGSPESGFVQKYNPDLETEFVVVHWEQRGAGKSYSKSIPVESMNVEQFISDTKELSEYLIKRFNQEKIYIMGHSWGSYLGILTIEKYPELYHCYLGIGQVSNQYRSEKISFDWIKEQAEKRQDKKALDKIEDLAFPGKEDCSKEWINFLMVERSYVDKFGGGIFHDYEGVWDKLSPVLNAKEYSLKDKFNFGLGSVFSLKHLWEEIITTNLTEKVDSIQIPVYIFQGLYDYQTSYIVAKEFYEQLQAPKKDFITFDKSAHCPIFDEPEKFNKKLKEIISYR